MIQRPFWTEFDALHDGAIVDSYIFDLMKKIADIETYRLWVSISKLKKQYDNI